MTTSMPRRINEKWLRRQREDLQITARTLADGSPNPYREEAEAKLIAALAERQAWLAFEAWMLARRGWRLNERLFRTPRETFEVGTVFVRKDGDKTVFCTIEKAWETYQAEMTK